jgi:hypothetical protein
VLDSRHQNRNAHKKQDKQTKQKPRLNKARKRMCIGYLPLHFVSRTVVKGKKQAAMPMRMHYPTKERLYWSYGHILGKRKGRVVNGKEDDKSWV